MRARTHVQLRRARCASRPRLMRRPLGLTYSKEKPVTTLLVFGVPVLVADVTASLRHRFGAWASWLCLVAVVVALTVLQPQSWWNHGFLEDLDEWFGQAFAAFVMALALQQFSRSRPILVPFAVAAVLGIGVQ